METKKNVLVTGATGLLGASLYPFLKKTEKYQVWGQGKKNSLDYACDLVDSEATDNLLEKCQPDVIVHLVALTNVDQCQNDFHQAYLYNVKTVENIASWIKKNKKSHLIYISTDQVYDQEGPHKEVNHRLTNAYALSKYAGEIAAHVVSGTVLRTNFFGPSQCSRRKSFSDWLVESFEEKRSIQLFTDVLFSPLHMNTLCKMIELVIDEPKGGVFNLGSHSGMSKRDFAHSLAKSLGLKTDKAESTKASDFGFSAYRPFDMRMDSCKFEAAFATQLPLLEEEIAKLRKEK